VENAGGLSPRPAVCHIQRFFSVDQEFQDRPAPPAESGSIDDLFGAPPAPYHDPRGRKKLKVTNDLREHVAVLRAGGMERDEIADAIGCSERTLRTYFLPELNEGKNVKRAEVVAKLFELGMAGSVPALKAFLALGVKADAIPRLPKDPKLGKKEQAKIDAHTAHQGGRWGALLEGAMH
jgi:DNA-binding CsgD family transcriptional regulator